MVIYKCKKEYKFVRFTINEQMIKTNSTLILLILSYFSFSQDTKFTGTVKILHTNDIHCNFSRFPRLAFVVDSIKNENENVLLLNAGDIFTGNPLVDMNTEKGAQMIELMNKVGFDLSVLGNHEFDYGQEVLAKRISEAKFPFICANVWNQGHNFKLPKPFVQLKNVDNLTINILGILDNSANWKPETHPKKVKGLVFTNPIETAQKFKHLKTNCDLFIALTHLGDNEDIELAKKMPAFDVIVGGHSHSKIDTVLMINDVLVTQAGAKLKYLGEITLKFENGKLTTKSSRLIELNKNGNVDQEIKELVQKYEQNPMFTEVVGRANEDITGKEELGSFFTDALRFEANLDIAFQNSGGIRVDKLPEGEINMEQILKLDPFGNYLMILEMDLDEIKSLISFSFERWGLDLKVSGINYTVTTINDHIESIDLVDYQGNTLDKNKKYIIGLNDYILSSYQFKHKDAGTSHGKTTAEVIIDYLKKQRSISYKGVQRTFHEVK